MRWPLEAIQIFKFAFPSEYHSGLGWEVIDFIILRRPTKRLWLMSLVMLSYFCSLVSLSSARVLLLLLVLLVLLVVGISVYPCPLVLWLYGAPGSPDR